jgi:hypothetical protein
VLNTQTQDPRWIIVKPSRIALAISLVGGVLAMVVALFWLPTLALSVQLALALIAAITVVVHVRRALLRSPTSVLAFYLLELDAPIDAVGKLVDENAGAENEKAPRPLQGMRLRFRTTAEEEEILARVQANGFVTPWFTAIPYCLDTDSVWRKWWPRLLPIWPDAIAADDFRKLRVQLKWR